MFILALKGKEQEGAYAVQYKKERTLLLFVDVEDAQRFVVLLEADNFPPMSIVKVDPETMIKMCESTGHKYTVVQPNELIIPPSP